MWHVAYSCAWHGLLSLLDEFLLNSNELLSRSIVVHVYFANEERRKDGPYFTIPQYLEAKPSPQVLWLCSPAVYVYRFVVRVFVRRGGRPVRGVVRIHSTTYQQHIIPSMKCVECNGVSLSPVGQSIHMQ